MRGGRGGLSCIIRGGSLDGDDDFCVIWSGGKDGACMSLSWQMVMSPASGGGVGFRNLIFLI